MADTLVSVPFDLLGTFCLTRRPRLVWPGGAEDDTREEEDHGVHEARFWGWTGLAPYYYVVVFARALVP